MNEREIWYQGLEANGADILDWLEASNRLTLMRWTHRLRHRLESFQPTSPLHVRHSVEAELFDGADEWHEWVRVNNRPVGWARAAMEFWGDTGYLEDAKLSSAKEAAIEKALRFETPGNPGWIWHDPFWAMRLDNATDDLPGFLERSARVVWDFHKRFEVFDYFLEQNEWNEEVRVSKQQCSAALRDDELMRKVKAVCEGSCDGCHATNEPFSDIDAESQSSTSEKQATSEPRASELQYEWLAKAMLIVREEPELSDAQIAKRVSKHGSTLSRNPAYQAAAKMARGSREKLRKGHRKGDSGTGFGDVEAYDLEDDFGG